MEKTNATNQNMYDRMTQGLSRLKGMLNEEQDVVDLILEDHKPLKELIEVMKDSEKPFEERKKAFSEFAPLLVTHAKAEEQSLYNMMKTKSELREEAFEGDTEHGLADQLCEEIKRTTDKDMLGARIRVLAELVEEHLREEEEMVLPEVRRKVGKDVLKQLNRTYIDVEEELIAQGQEDSPHESEMRRRTSGAH